MADDIFTALGKLQQTLQITAQVAVKAAGTVQSSASRIETAADVANKGAATKFDDLLYKVQQYDTAINKIAVKLLENVKNGITPASEAMNALGDAAIEVDGKMQSFRDLLLQVLPSVGQVQEQIDQLIAGIHTYDDAVKALRETNNDLAISFADLIEAYKAGKVTIDAVIKEAQRLKQLSPSGTAEGRIADAVANGLNNGFFG